jgi:prophage antirepressor-like protein
MSAALTSFENSFTESLKEIFQGKEFGYFNQNGKVWFIAKEICDILGLKNVSQAVNRLKPSEKMDIILNDIPLVPGDNGKRLLISESGFYKLVMKSKMPDAENFQDYVTEKILPQIRQTGTFNQAPQLTTKEILQLALKSEEEREKLVQLTNHQNKLIEFKDEVIKEKNQKLDEYKPVVDFVESNFKPSKKSIYIGEFAKIHGFIYPDGRKVSYKGTNGIFQLLRGEVAGYSDIKYLAWNNVALAKYDSNHGNGYFEVKEYEENFAPSSRITTKGQEAIFKKFAKYGIHPESKVGV